MALTSRFATVDKAVLIATGNSLVLCGSSSAPAINTSDLVQPDGTPTRDWTLAGSTAYLDLLSSSTILYAELIWYSTVFSNVSGALDLRSIQDTPITFTTSKGSYLLTPQYVDSYTGQSGTIDRYRATDVTSYVQEALSGNYTVSHVPISVPTSGLSNSRAGWTLVVIYRHNRFLPQKVLYNSGIFVATPDMPFQSTFAGFTTSADPTLLQGNMMLSCANGGPLNGLESVYVGPSFAQLTNIGNSVYAPNANPGTKPNNPGNSFFSGVINVANPLSDTNSLINISGTNGTLNHDGFVPTQTLGGRNKWDITNVDISHTLVPNQTLLAAQITTGEIGDGVQLVALGAQVQAKAPNIIATLYSYDIDGDSEYNAEVGEPLVYSVQIKNDGDLAADHVIISTTLNSATSFVTGSVLINGIAYPTAHIETGINLGTLAPHSIVTVFFTAKINKIPTGGMLYQTVNYNYTFTSGIDTLTNDGTTNTIEVIIQDGLLAITASASKSSLSIDETLKYTIHIENIGTELAQNLFFQNPIDLHSSFIEDSVQINGISYPNYNPITGFALDNLNVHDSLDIGFQVKLNTLPVYNQLTNAASITFAYLFNQYEYLRQKTITSNTTIVPIAFVDIIGERCNNNSYPQVGDTITYTLSLTNTGTLDATDISVQEPLIPGASFVSGSVKLNGTSYPELNPFTGFTLPNTIPPQTTYTIEYRVLINSMDPAHLIENTATVPFKYQIIPGGTTISNEKDSNTVDTITTYVCMHMNKSVNTTHATLNDILYYTVQISNDGNINATNTTFIDTLQDELTFVEGSVAINGISYPSYNPNQGFLLGVICPSDVIEVTFKAQVTALPIPHTIYNQAHLVYSYKPDPTGSTLSNTIFSNTVETLINQVQYNVVKTVDKVYAQVGDFLVYTTTINNTGTVPLTNMQFADFLGVFLSFYPGTVHINGINYPSYNPAHQFPLGTMLPGDRMTIVFGVSIVSNPPVGYIPNISEVSLTYQTNPNTPVVTKTVYSNSVKTYIPYAELALIKMVDKAYAVVSDILTYSFTVTNNGNTTAIHTLFNDVLPIGTTFIPGSVVINGINKPSLNPQTGFTLGDLLMGQTINLSFKATASSLPSPHTIKNSATATFSYAINPSEQPTSRTTTSNPVTTIINAYSATLTKYVDQAYGTLGTELSYTIIANNTGTVPLTNVYLIDSLPTGVTFVPGSVIIDGVSNSTANPNTGFLINNVLPNGNVVVMFKATVTSVPTPPQINNQARITFNYQLAPTASIINSSLTSNTVTTTLNKVSVTHVKSVNKLYATKDEVITYTSTLTNTGTTSLTNTQFIDMLTSELTFVPGSVKINNVAYPDYTPLTGFTLGILSPSSQTIITFDATVTTVPASGYVTNTSLLNYDYKIDPNQPAFTSSITSNTVTTTIRYGSVMITKTANQTVVKLSTNIIYDFVITNTGNTTLKNLLFKDLIQVESLFDPGSVYINGINKPTYNPHTGFSLVDLPVGQQTLISFTVTSNALPPNHQLLNTAQLTYSYYVDPNGPPTTSTEPSNPTTIYVYDTIMSATKTVDKTYAQLTDTLNFTITIKNEGNTTAENIFFQDILDPHLTLVPDSVYINGVQKLGYNPTTGFDLNNIAGGGTTTTVLFAATINSRPPNNLIPNYATLTYDYTVASQVISAMINTNTTQTYVTVGELTLTKTVDKTFATLDDYLAYTITIKNTGSVDATNLYFEDSIPPSTSFKNGSVVINGIPEPSYDPHTGFNLTTLLPNQTHIITFSIKVDDLPVDDQVQNTAYTTFSYKLTPTSPPITTTTPSNTVTTSIKLASISATKTVDQAYATLGNTLNYTIVIQNTGNTTCFDLFFQDMIQSDAQFVSGSVKINHVAYETYDPSTGFYLPDLASHSTTTVTFSVTVQTLPADYIIYNHATGVYKYYINPANPPIVVENITNTVTTQINVGALTATKAVNKAYATLNDILSYTITLVNTGNTIAKYINFRDVLPTGLTFVTGSVTINEVAYPTYNPYNSFTLGHIISGDSIVIKFNAKVTSLPTPSLITNTADVTFSYRVDPNGPDIPMVLTSNTVSTQINIGLLNVTKNVDLSYATAKDVLTYRFSVINTGNVQTDYVLFTDNLQSDITFNAGSVIVNDVAQPDYNPTIGFSLGTIEPLESVTVSFTVTIIDLPTRTSLLNYAEATFAYKVDPSGQYYHTSSSSNTVSTILIMPKLSASKLVNKPYVTLQDTLNYSVLVKNEGNTTLSNLFFADFLSNGATFKTGTVTINGTSYPSFNPITGFNLPYDLIAGTTALIEFQSSVAFLPSPPQVTNYALSNGEYHIHPAESTYPISTASNTVSTLINVGRISHTKSVDKIYARVNDTVLYTATLTNTGNVNTTNLFFQDLLQTELTFVSGTVSINGTFYPALNPTTGFSLSTLAPGQTTTITFSAKINALPIPAYVSNTSTVDFSYKIDPLGSTIVKNQSSNTVTTHVVLGKVNAVKTVDKPIATINDILTYKVTLTNLGNTLALDTFFQDTPSSGVTFKTGSVKINGLPQPTFNPITGFNLEDIGIGNVITVEFDVDVVSVPISNQVTNQAALTFKYVVDPKQSPYTETSYSNTVTTNIAYGNLSVTKTVNKRYATAKELLTYTITIVNTGNINATNVIFLDPTPEHSTFVIGSVTINGTPYPDYNPSAGFNLNTMTPGQIITIVYKVQVIDLCE